MAHSYEYAVLTAVPNPRRGERVNVGIVVFLPDRTDVRFKHAEYKLRALTGENWGVYIESMESSIKRLTAGNAQERLKQLNAIEPLLQPSELGHLRAANDAQYETQIEQILASLVALPKREKTETKTRINTEISKEFRRLRLLAQGDESIEDHKIVRDFAIDAEENLVADFALKNGKLIVTSTLDLRKQASSLAEAALKSITLDKATRKYHDAVKTVGVYVVDQGMKETFKPQISMLGDYAELLYDWGDRDERDEFKRRVFDALKFTTGNGFF
jgi:hypothetical protein